MLARSSYYIASRIGVVLRQMCCCTELTGPSRASISYMAKFLAACTLCSWRDFQVFNYLSSYPCNQDFLLLKDFLSFLLVFYSKDYRAEPSLWIISLFIRYNPSRLSLYPNRIKCLYFFLQKLRASLSQEGQGRNTVGYYLNPQFQFLFSFKDKAVLLDFLMLNQKIYVIFFCSYKENILFPSSSSYRGQNWLFYLQF